MDLEGPERGAMGQPETIPDLREPSSPAETGEVRQRGICITTHDRRVLFKQDMELDVRKLPRWKPHIIVSHRSQADDE